MDQSSEFDFPLDFDQVAQYVDLERLPPASPSSSLASSAGLYADSLDNLDQELQEEMGEAWDFVDPSPPSPWSDERAAAAAGISRPSSGQMSERAWPAVPSVSSQPEAELELQEQPFHNLDFDLAHDLDDNFDDDDEEPAPLQLSPFRPRSAMDLTGSPPPAEGAQWAAENMLALPFQLPQEQDRDRPRAAAAEARPLWPGRRQQEPVREQSAQPQDELVELEVAPGAYREQQRHHQRHHQRRRQQQGPALPQATFIDLTEEPDSPVLLARPPPSRNPRRQMSQNHRTPSLARSDGSILAEPARPPVIDLTEDSPEEGPAAAPARSAHGGRQQHRARNRFGHHHHRHHHHHHLHQSPDVAILGILADVNALHQQEAANRGDFFGGLRAVGNYFRMGRRQPPDVPQHEIDPRDVQEVEFMGGNLVLNAAMDNPLLGNPVQFNYQANGFGQPRAPTPKPPHVPPPPAREGFTRNTGGDVVAVCASCEEELKYDPDTTEEGPPAKRARSRKDREEHHFWAVTACGHVRSVPSPPPREHSLTGGSLQVYCRECYETRSNTGKKDKAGSLHFRVEGKTLSCAVPDCESDVKPKKAWVGIFL